MPWLPRTRRDPTSKQFYDDEWIRSLAEAQDVTTDIPEDSVTYDRHPKSSAHSDGRVLAKMRVAASMRQIGVGTPGGAEALAIFRQLLIDEWMTGSLRRPLARMKVDEKNCFGVVGWWAAREAAPRFLPKHTVAAA